MSNPGVIELFGFGFKDNFGGSHFFRIEDNIGESIHFHFDNIRLDLTVEEFREFADDMLDAITNILNVKGFDAKKYDPLFLFDINRFIIGLREIQFEYMPVKNIVVDTLDKDGKLVFSYLENSRMVKALRGDYSENDARPQHNLIGQNNLERLFSIFESVRKNGYPFNDEYIVVADKESNIIDGQHRAASIYVLNPEAVIPVQRWLFQDDNA